MDDLAAHGDGRCVVGGRIHGGRGRVDGAAGDGRFRGSPEDTQKALPLPLPLCVVDYRLVPTHAPAVVSPTAARSVISASATSSLPLQFVSPWGIDVNPKGSCSPRSAC